MDILASFSVTDLFDWIPNLWNFQIVIVDNKPITFGKIITGIILFVLGYFICRSASRQFSKTVLARMDIDHSLRHTLQTIIFYVMLVILTFFVLGLLNVPITIFTVLGGALALGVGIGSQNLVNNFLSGLVIMIENPVKVGDIIQVDNLTGRVETVGARSTQIKSLDNTHYVIPNSHILENSVLNWTLSDDLIRSKIVVGVAYGSDTAKVEEVLKQAAAEEELILNYPEPIVIFSEFGDNALGFEVYFWTRIKDMMSLMSLQSTMRFRIDGLFRDSGITIAFPQRDVHLDTLKPLEIKVLK